jgi:hypothetical protein
MEMVDLSYAFIRSSFVRHFRFFKYRSCSMFRSPLFVPAASTTLSLINLGFMGGLLEFVVQTFYKQRTTRGAHC